MTSTPSLHCVSAVQSTPATALHLQNVDEVQPRAEMKITATTAARMTPRMSSQLGLRVNIMLLLYISLPDHVRGWTVNIGAKDDLHVRERVNNLHRCSGFTPSPVLHFLDF